MTTSVMQALATGLPTITTRHSAFSDQIKDGKNGFLVDEGDYKKLAKKILYYMERPEIWAEFGKFGRKHIMKSYNSKVLIEKQIEFYYKVKRPD